MLHIQLEEKQEALLRRFASDKNLSLSEFVHRAVLEYLEDEADRRAFEAAKREFAADPVTYSHEEVLRLLEEDPRSMDTNEHSLGSLFHEDKLNNSEYHAKLTRSLAQLNRGEEIVKTLDELEALANI